MFNTIFGNGYVSKYGSKPLQEQTSYKPNGDNSRRGADYYQHNSKKRNTTVKVIGAVAACTLAAVGIAKGKIKLPSSTQVKGFLSGAKNFITGIFKK